MPRLTVPFRFIFISRFSLLNWLLPNVIPFDVLEQSQAMAVLLSTSVEKEGQLERVRTRKKGDSFIRFIIHLRANLIRIHM